MKQIVLLFALLFAMCIFGQAQGAKDTRLMSDAEYRVFLNQVDAHLSEWEHALQSVDPARSKVTYATGENIIRWKNLGLMEVRNARYYIQQERIKRRVSKELGLQGFLQGIFDMVGSILIEDPSVDVPLEKYAPTMGEFIKKIGNDATARVELLEKETCP